MKIDISRKITRGAQRTLDAFSASLFHLLSRNSFESITVHEICRQSNYPRATFYNYFDDKYDLLNYCWHCLYKQIRLEEIEKLEPEERLTVSFDRLYDFIAANQMKLKAIMQFNSDDNVLLLHFRVHLGSRMREVFNLGTCISRYTIPYELVAEHYCNTILLILEWRFLRENECSKTEALRYLHVLLGTLDFTKA